MKRTSLLAGASLLVMLAVAGGLYTYAVREGEAEVADAAARIRGGLGPSGSFSYESLQIHPLLSTASLDRVALRASDGTLYTADRLTVARGALGHLRTIHADRIRVADGDGNLQATALDAADVMVPTSVQGAPTGVDPAAITFTEATLRDVALSVPKSTITASSVEVGSYGAGRPSTVAVAGATVLVVGSPQFDSVGLGAFRMTGVDVASLVDAVEHSRRPPVMVGAGSLSAEAFYVAKGSKHFVQIAKGQLTGTTDIAKPSWSKLIISGVSMVPFDPDATAKLQAVGLNAIRFDTTVSLEYNPTAAKFRASPVLVTLQGLGTIELGFDLVHVDLTALQDAKPDWVALGASMISIGLADAHMRVVDAGALDKMFSVRARAEGVSEATLRQAVVQKLRDDEQFETSIPDDGLRSVLEEFLSRGGSLEVHIAPRSPISVAQLAAAEMNPGSLLPSMNLTSRWSDGTDARGSF